MWWLFQEQLDSQLQQQGKQASEQPDLQLNSYDSDPEEEDESPLDSFADSLLSATGSVRQQFVGSGSLFGTNTVRVLLEIVGAIGLRTKRKSNKVVDPSCVVKIQFACAQEPQIIHKTRTIHEDSDPIWTIKTKSLCLVPVPELLADVSASTSEALSKGRMIVEIRNKKSLLGHVEIPFTRLLEGVGDRVEFDVIPKPGLEVMNAVLSLRFRRATAEDVDFLGKVRGPGSFSKTSDKDIQAMQALQMPPAWDINFRNVKGKNLFQFYSKKSKTGEKLIRVQPNPDPDRPREETEWMTREQLHEEAMKPSKKWITAGNGEYGTLFVEVLGCNDLPNMDISINDFTDAVVGIVYEDTMVRTPVIWDDLNPRFMPWTSRAFAFRINHPSSILTFGVFDFDETPIDYHDPIGRVVIHPSSCRSGVTYLMHYKLRHDARDDPDESRGTIIIRIRLEWSDEKAVTKAMVTTPPRYIINVDNDKSFQFLRYLLRGSVDMEQATLKTVQLYAKELTSYWDSYCFFLDVLFEIMLWRGRVQLTPTVEIWFPISSMGLFLAVALSIEYPKLIIPMLLYTMGLAMVNINYFASQHPNPWKRAKPYVESKMVALTGRSFYKPQGIEAGQGQLEGAIVDQVDEIKGQRMSNLISALLDFLLKVYRIYSKTSVSSVAVATEVSNWDFLSGKLYYVHMLLKYLCLYIRMFRNFVNWRSYGSDSFATQCIVIATVWMTFPVPTLALWVLQIWAWAILGPWMKLVDIYWVHHWYPTSLEIFTRLKNGETELDPMLPDVDAFLNSDFFRRMGHSGRVMAKDSYNLKDRREQMFGYYSDVVPPVDNSRVPYF